MSLSREEADMPVHWSSQSGVEKANQGVLYPGVTQRLDSSCT